MKKIILLFSVIFCGIYLSAQTFITPNTSIQDTTLQVFISGNDSSLFFTQFSCSSPPALYLEEFTEGYTIAIPNTAESNWQYNASVGSTGFYSTISIPYDAYLGNYNLVIYDWDCGEILLAVYNNVFAVTLNSAPYISNFYGYSSGNHSYNSVSVGRGEALDVTISGGNLDYGNTWSNTSGLRFSYSDTLGQLGSFIF